MVESVKEGTSYKVISDNMGFFKPGDIVVALETDNVPYCCLKEDYHGPFTSTSDYHSDEYSALCRKDLEEIE